VGASFFGDPLQPMVQLSRSAAGVVPVDDSIRPPPFQSPLILPVTYHPSPNPFTIRHNPHRSTHDPHKLYLPPAGFPAFGWFTLYALAISLRAS